MAPWVVVENNGLRRARQRFQLIRGSAGGGNLQRLVGLSRARLQLKLRGGVIGVTRRAVFRDDA
jgi:hypothetical protein